MAKRTLLDLPEELLTAILWECRILIHPSVKEKHAEPIDFDAYSDFHLRLDNAEYLSVLLTCKKIHRIGAPLAYDCLNLIDPALPKLECYPSFPRHYSTVPREWPEEQDYSSVLQSYRFEIVNTYEGVELARARLTFPPRPKTALSCRALNIDPRFPVS